MTRHDDNLARLAAARAKLAETTPGEWYLDDHDVGAEMVLSGIEYTFDAHVQMESETALTSDWCGWCDLKWPCPDYLNAEDVLKAVTP